MDLFNAIFGDFGDFGDSPILKFEEDQTKKKRRLEEMYARAVDVEWEEVQ